MAQLSLIHLADVFLPNLQRFSQVRELGTMGIEVSPQRNDDDSWTFRFRAGSHHNVIHEDPTLVVIAAEREKLLELIH